MNRSGVSALLTVSLLVASLMVTSGCGKEDKTTGVTPDCTAPFGSTITVTPSVATIDGIIPSASDAKKDFKVMVTYPDPDNEPMPKACIKISGDQAAPADNYAYTFYYYPGGPTNPSGNSAVSSGYIAQTNDYGYYEFSVLISAGTGSFSDTITVTSGANSATAQLEFGTGTATP